MPALDLGTDLWRLDAVSILLLVLVVGIAAAVLPYAHRSLRGDRHGRGVTVAIGAMLVATALVSVAGPIWMLALAWSAATAATLAALGLGGGARALARATPWLLVSDAALWGAVALMLSGVEGDATALLLVGAAVVRCALPPAHSWLVDSLHAPTPVSAALHGGIVNGGGILIITQFAVVGSSALAVSVLAVLGGLAVVVGVLAALMRTDIKGRLVMSTVAQMGFMLLVAALGLTAAALLHLVAHGLYKSALFLSSNDGIDRRATERRAPRALPLRSLSRSARSGIGALLPVAALALAALAVYPGGRGAAELLVLVVLAAAFGIVGAQATAMMPGTVQAVLAAFAVAGAAVLFVLLTSALTGLIGRSASSAGGGAVVAIGAVCLLAVGGIAMVRRWAPHGTVGLALLALGHATGAPRTSRSPDLRREHAATAEFSPATATANGARA
ncbi:proton-conducting transporter membrane subunit [Microcella sp.]|uniref:proton-conducting transporter transmembrane domain-containing protein n=1 Tax=Microcella sp. TaxID=1913979 RepID=UPI002563A59B|nr:proton-conducting transporter membrane subunit [Microcella sp.]MBX9471440.1 hypothetical protein [Microcella sp.]